MYFRPDSHRQHPSFMSAAEQKTSGQCVLLCSSFRILFILAAARISHYIHAVDKHTTLRWRRDFHLFVCASLSHAQKKKAAAWAARNVHASRQPERDLIWRGGGGRDTRRAQKHTQAHRICLRLNRFFSFSWESCVWEKTWDPERARLKDERKRDLQRAPSVPGALRTCLLICMKCGYPTWHMSNCCTFCSNKT